MLKAGLIEIIGNSDEALQNGTKLRNRLAQQIQLGETPTGYRYDFLVNSAYRLIDELGNIARDFNDAHPDDRCSTIDFCDILATATEIIKQNSEKKR